MSLNKKKKLLIIASCHVHNRVAHAGGKTVNYYLSKFSNVFDVSYITLGEFRSDEFNKMTIDHPKVKVFVDDRTKNFLQRFRDYVTLRYIYPILKEVVPWYFLSNGFQFRRYRYLINQVEDKDQIDYVLVEFTQTIFFIELFRKSFMNAKFIASSHDVTTQAVERYMDKRKNHLYKAFYKRKFRHLEKSKLLRYDLVVVHNQKDRDLANSMLDIPLQNLHTISPYFDQYQMQQSTKDGIIFFGAMDRDENKDAVLWFLSHVWLDFTKNEQHKLKFYIVGGGLTDSFEKSVVSYSDVFLTGFVKDPSVYFSKSYAMVIPLQTGAGIKVKTIEGLASGLPVLCNSIGIEGIQAHAGVHYVHCDTIEEWRSRISDINENPLLYDRIGQNGKKLISDCFDLEDSAQNYINRIQHLDSL